MESPGPEGPPNRKEGREGERRRGREEERKKGEMRGEEGKKIVPLKNTRCSCFVFFPFSIYPLMKSTGGT